MQTDDWLFFLRRHSGEIQLLVDWGGPVVVALLAVLISFWLRWQIERWLERFFPLRAWEKELGWLNLRAFRRAELLWRGLGWFAYAVLAGLLVVMALTVQAPVRAWAERGDLIAAAEQVPECLLFFGSAFIWLFIIVIDWWPRYRARREEALLRAYRLAHPHEREGNEAAGVASDLSRRSRSAPTFSLLESGGRKGKTERQRFL